jgi:hypothetical protein
MSQAIHDADGKALPAVMTRRNRSPWLVCMRLDDWLRLYGAWRMSNEANNQPYITQ